MPKKKGSVSESGVKQCIIKCIFSTNKSVKERDIRGYLEEKYKKRVDQGNINRHLHELCEELGCIELIPPVKKGLANHWDITKTDHLRNIMNKFHGIQLNKYEKSLMIVLQKNGYDIRDLSGLEFYFRLLLSSSFFEACIDTDVNILIERSRGVYAYKYSSESIILESQKNVCYNSYIARYPNFKMPYESFVSMLTQMSLKEASSEEMFMEIWEEELLGISKEESDEIHGETREGDLKIYEEMALVATDIMLMDISFKNESFSLLFEHYLNHDTLNNVALNEDLMFALIMKAIEEEEESCWKNWSEETHLKLDKLDLSKLEQLSKMIAKYKQPSIYCNNFIDDKGIYNALKEIFYVPNEVSENDTFEPTGPVKYLLFRSSTSPFTRRF